jgi:hypothetical protein
MLLPARAMLVFLRTYAEQKDEPQQRKLDFDPNDLKYLIANRINKDKQKQAFTLPQDKLDAKQQQKPDISQVCLFYSSNFEVKKKKKKEKLKPTDRINYHTRLVRHHAGSYAPLFVEEVQTM